MVFVISVLGFNVFRVYIVGFISTCPLSCDDGCKVSG